MTENFSFEVIVDMVQHRGYFDDAQGRGCAEVDRIIHAIRSSQKESDGAVDDVGGVNRIVVGHTPHDYSHERCGGRLLASDSSLSRTFRAHGNMYCPISDRMVEEYGGASVTCEKRHEEVCMGSISVIRRSSAEKDWPRSVTRMRHDDLVKKMDRGVPKEDDIDGSSGDGSHDTDEL